jgi:hypothetical protein
MPIRIDQSIRKEVAAENLKTPRLMPLKKAAELLGLTVWALRERIWAGHIPVVQFPGGRKQYVDIRDLDAFIDSHKRIVE